MTIVTTQDYLYIPPSALSLAKPTRSRVKSIVSSFTAKRDRLSVKMNQVVAKVSLKLHPAIKRPPTPYALPMEDETAMKRRQTQSKQDPKCLTQDLKVNDTDAFHNELQTRNCMQLEKEPEIVSDHAEAVLYDLDLDETIPPYEMQILPYDPMQLVPEYAEPEYTDINTNSEIQDTALLSYRELYLISHYKLSEKKPLLQQVMINNLVNLKIVPHLPPEML